MSMDGHGTRWRRKIAENFNRLSRAHQHLRQTTDGMAIAYSEREREFTFAQKPSGNDRFFENGVKLAPHCPQVRKKLTMLVIAGTRTNSRRLRTFIEKPSDESEDRIRIRLLVKTVRKNLEFIIFTFLSFLHCSGSHTLDKDDQSNYRPIFNLSVKSNWASRPMGQVTQVRPYMARLLDVLSRPSRTCGHDRSGQVGH